MEVREAAVEDIPAIVDLLKMSLGERLMPKSERYWHWKHVENPFGPSPVLLCWENHELIGVRAFMRWEWIENGQIYRSVRAVDTATHPDHQGKGIFKKLTLSLVDNCKRQHDHFVFNTPNQQSKPGYLKMGWEESGKLPIKISVERPMSILKNLIAGGHSTSNENSALKYYLRHPKLESLLSEHKLSAKTLVTNQSTAYLTWRYLDVPVARYIAVGEEQGAELTGLIIGRIKETRFGRELRLTDYFLKENCNEEGLKRKLVESKKNWGIDYTTASGTSYSGKVFSSFTLQALLGPMVTIRSLSMVDLHLLRKFKQWSPSLGDLELF